MADHSIAKPCGVIEDVFVQVHKFIYPVDFVVLDMGDDNEIQLIHGRPFLATGRALIDVEAGCLTLRVDNAQVHFHKSHSAEQYEVKPMCKGGEVEATLETAIRVADSEGMILQKELTKSLSMKRHLRLYLKRLKRGGKILNTPVAATPILASNAIHKRKQQFTVELLGQ